MRSIIGVCTSPPEAESFAQMHEFRWKKEREGGGRRSRGDHLRIVEYTRSTNIQRYYVPSALFRL